MKHLATFISPLHSDTIIQMHKQLWLLLVHLTFDLSKMIRHIPLLSEFVIIIILIAYES